jgi:hypothetical protein
MNQSDIRGLVHLEWTSADNNRLARLLPVLVICQNFSAGRSYQSIGSSAHPEDPPGKFFLAPI